MRLHSIEHNVAFPPFYLSTSAVTEPIFWLGLSLGLVALSLVMVLAALVPAVTELRRAARSVEKLADTLSRELPPTLEAIRLTGLEITELTEDVSDGVKNAGEVVQQVNQGVTGVKKQAQKVHGTTRRVMAGVRAAWQTWQRHSSPSKRRANNAKRLAGDRGDSVEFPRYAVNDDRDDYAIDPESESDS
jgi:uncharacterized protein YoxC